MKYDYCVIGGGIVGLATTMKLQQMHRDASVVLLDKESRLASHQTGHNSGVIHSGIYYTPGSLKADLCRQGAEVTKAFCRDNDIPFQECGKLLVATNETELARLHALEQRARANLIEIEYLSADQLGRREPNITGLGAIFVPSTGIVDYRLVAQKMAEAIQRAGGKIVLGARVDQIREGRRSVTVRSAQGRFEASQLIACAGVQSDRIARMAGLKVSHRIVPFRGEYFLLPPEKNNIVKHLIYPVPDPDLPFLGIHLTRVIDGTVTVGPNAVLGLAREGSKRSVIDVRDVVDYLLFPGLWRTLFANWRSVLTEARNSLWKPGYLSECRKYCPSLSIEELKPYPAGIRAQAIARDGTLVHDFLFLETERMIHVCNAPSPAATSAMPIGEMIASKAIARCSTGTTTDGS